MRSLIIILTSILLQACAPTTYPENAVDARPLSADNYLQLSPEQQYRITNKLLGTLYKGVSVDQFFDVNKGLSTPSLANATDHLQQIRTQLVTTDDNVTNHLTKVQNKYFNTESRLRNTRAIPMALFQELPLSKEYYHRWMAYTLMNTILFSSAYELDSVDHTDVETIFNIHLVEALRDNKTISQIVYEHMISQENWRRFRSPEDNTREMMEIFLMRFRDDEVPLASIACKNWYLTDDAEGYQLRKNSLIINTEPQTLLDRNDIVTCKDFFRAVSTHPSLIPTVTRRLVDYFFAGYPVSQRNSLANRFIASKPKRFREIFESILFSREYLLHNSRTKSYEETLYGTGARIDWYAWNYMFHDINDNNPGSSRPDLGEMRQATMTYKLGRNNAVPTDSLSLAYYHKSIRDRLFLDRRYSTDPLNTSDGGWGTSFLTPVSGAVELLSDEDFIHYVMLATLARKASSEELAALSAIIINNGHSNSRINQAWLIMDYASRLSEFYTLPAISGVN